MQSVRLARVRRSAPALALAALAWSGCAATRPMVDPWFEARSYTPARIALLPPAVFAVADQVGDNDPQQSAALGQALSAETTRLVSEALRARGYDVNLSARWDGVYAADGSVLLGGHELAWLSSSILQFANSETGGGEGPMQAPAFVAPELAARVGWATGSDALLYLNLKGVSVSEGKRTAQVLGVVFFVVVLAAIVLLMTKDRGGGPARSGGGPSQAFSGRPVPRAGAAPRGSAAVTPGAPTQAHLVPRGRGAPPRRGGGRTYGGPRVGVGVGLYATVPVAGPAHTHEGTVADDDSTFAGDQLYFSMTLISAADGRVLWHLRDDADVEIEDPAQVQRFVDRVLSTLPPALPAAPP